MKTVFLDTAGLEDLDLTALKAECSSLDLFPTTAPEQVVERLTGAELAILNKVRLTAESLDALPDLRLVCVVATGTDIVDLAAARARGVTVCNCQAYGTDSVVQHVFSALLALHTNLLRYHQAVQAGRWQQAEQFCFLDYPITEIKGKTLGIVGFGNLGQGIAAIARAFGMHVVIIRRPGAAADDRPALTDILPDLDVLTLHCPLTESTRNLIDSKALALMKPTAFLINAARGGIVDEHALALALREKRLAGAAIDVLSTEPPRQSNILLDTREINLIVTPHTAWASREARQRIIDQTVENIEAYKNGRLLRVVN